MKKLFLLIFGVLFILSCNKKTELTSENPNNIDNSKAQLGLFLTGCDNETWDGDINEDCYGDPSNCVVICGEVSSHQYYPDFVKAVKDGTSADFYENGHGMDVLPITTEAYNDLINGVTDFYKVNSSDGDKYALY